MACHMEYMAFDVPKDESFSESRHSVTAPNSEKDRKIARHSGCVSHGWKSQVTAVGVRTSI